MGILNKRSISINGHKTGIFVEGPFWDGLKEIASVNKMTLSALVAAIDNRRTARNLSSAIRVYVLDYYRIHASSGTQPGVSTLQDPPLPSSTRDL